jgi:hypothetical protein
MPDPLRAADFKPVQIVGMIDDPHLIRFLIPDPQRMQKPGFHASAPLQESPGRLPQLSL